MVKNFTARRGFANFVNIMAEDYIIRPIWDDSQFKQGAMNSIDLLDKMNGELDELQQTTVASSKKMSTATQAHTKVLNQQAEKLKETSVETLTYSQALQKAADNVNIMGVNLGNTIRALNAKRESLKAVVSGLSAGTKGLQLFKVALIGTGVGAFVVAIGSLVAWLTKTQKGIDTVNKIMSAFGATVSVITDRLANVGGAIAGLLSGTKTISQAWGEVKEQAKGVSEEITNEATAAYKLTGQLQELKRAEDELNVKRAQSRAEIKELNKIAEDVTKSDQVRSEAARKAIEIETSLMNEKQSLLEKQLAAQKALDDQGISTHADLEEQRRLQIEIANTAQESLELQTTLTNKLNTIRDQTNAKVAAEAARVSELKQSWYDLFNEIVKQREDDEAVTQYDRERLAIRRSIEALEEQKKQIKEVGEAAGVLPEKIAEGIREIEKIELSLKTRIDYINDKEADNREALEVLKRKVEDGLVKGDPLKLTVPTIVSPEIEDSFSLTDFKDKLLDSLGISDEEANQILESLGSVLSNIQEMLLASSQQRIEELNNEIEQRRENIEKLEEDLELQLELEQEGFANSVETTRAKIDEELAAENEAIEERDKLRKKEQALQAATQTLSQIGSLITAGAKIFEAESGKGIVGVALAAAAIVGMLATFAKLKSDAKAKSKLSKGAERIADHIMNVGNKSDRFGSGYSIHDADTGQPTGVVIGGDESIMRAEVSQSQRALFEDMNRNPTKYQDIDILSMVNGQKETIEHFMSPVAHPHKQYAYISFVDPDSGQPYYIEKVNGKTTGRFLIET